MKDGCPFRYLKTPRPSPQGFPNVEVAATEVLDPSFYNQMLHCRCALCGQDFSVRMEANPYFETHVWPARPPCEGG